MERCEKCDLLRGQRDKYLFESLETKRKTRAEVAALRKRLEEVQGDRYTRDDELTYLLYDLEACLNTLGWRPDNEEPTYGGPDGETMRSELEYVRDMLQANYRFYSKRNPCSSPK